MLDLMRVWYTDSNSIVRQKQETAAIKRIVPMLTKIVRQGIAEGVFTSTYPDQIGGMIWGLAQGIFDNVADLLLSEAPPADALQRLEAIVGPILRRWNVSWARRLVLSSFLILLC